MNVSISAMESFEVKGIGISIYPLAISGTILFMYLNRIQHYLLL